MRRRSVCLTFATSKLEKAGCLTQMAGRRMRMSHLCHRLLLPLEMAECLTQMAGSGMRWRSPVSPLPLMLHRLVCAPRCLPPLGDVSLGWVLSHTQGWSGNAGVGVSPNRLVEECVSPSPLLLSPILLYCPSALRPSRWLECLTQKAGRGMWSVSECFDKHQTSKQTNNK